MDSRLRPREDAGGTLGTRLGGPLGGSETGGAGGVARLGDGAGNGDAMGAADTGRMKLFCVRKGGSYALEMTR